MCLSSRIYCVRSFCFFRVLRGLSATGKTAVAFCIHSKKKPRHKNGSEACLRSRMTAERYWQRMQARKVKRLRCINLCIYYVWSGFSGTPSSAFAYWVWSPRVQRLISESLKRNSFICLSSFVCFFFLSSLLWMKNAVAVVSRAMDVTRTDIANLVKQRNSRLRSPYLVLLFFTFCPRFVFKDCFDYNAHNELRQSGVSSIAAVIGALLLCRGSQETKRKEKPHTKSLAKSPLPGTGNRCFLNLKSIPWTLSSATKRIRES